MKKILISLLFALASGVCANAQLLYRVSGANLKKPSYVFGTFHPDFVTQKTYIL